MLNYHLSQKLNLIGYGKFNISVDILTLPITRGLKFSHNKCDQTCKIFN
jgi:hypothetical protein